MRLKPRYNDEVNDWWMCDAGRYGYKSIDHDRITEPIVRLNGVLKTADWSETISSLLKAFKELLKTSKDEIAVLISSDLTNEEIYLARKLFIKELGLDRVHLVRSRGEGDQDELLIRADKHPNRKGAEWVGFEENEKSIRKLLDDCIADKLKGLVIFGQDLVSLYPDRNVADILHKLELSVFIGSNHNLTSEQVQFVLPAATYAEKNGTFTNFEGRVQRIRRSLVPLGESKSELEILMLFADKFGFNWNYKNEEAVFEGLKRSVSFFGGMTYEKIGKQGIKGNV